MGKEIQQNNQGKKMLKRLAEIFEDDTKALCVGRVSLVLGLVLTVITATVDMDVAGEVTWAECVLRCSPGIIGLVAYITTRLFEAKEFIAEISEKVIKAKNK